MALHAPWYNSYMIFFRWWPRQATKVSEQEATSINSQSDCQVLISARLIVPAPYNAYTHHILYQQLAEQQAVCARLLFNPDNFDRMKQKFDAGVKAPLADLEKLWTEYKQFCEKAQAQDDRHAALIAGAQHAVQQFGITITSSAAGSVAALYSTRTVGVDAPAPVPDWKQKVIAEQANRVSHIKAEQPDSIASMFHDELMSPAGLAAQVAARQPAVQPAAPHAAQQQ